MLVLPIATKRKQLVWLSLFCSDCSASCFPWAGENKDRRLGWTVHQTILGNTQASIWWKGVLNRGKKNIWKTKLLRLKQTVGNSTKRSFKQIASCSSWWNCFLLISDETFRFVSTLNSFNTFLYTDISSMEYIVEVVNIAVDNILNFILQHKSNVLEKCFVFYLWLHKNWVPQSLVASQWQSQSEMHSKIVPCLIIYRGQSERRKDNA